MVFRIVKTGFHIGKVAKVKQIASFWLVKLQVPSRRETPFSRYEAPPPDTKAQEVPLQKFVHFVGHPAQTSGTHSRPMGVPGQPPGKRGPDKAMECTGAASLMVRLLSWATASCPGSVHTGWSFSLTRLTTCCTFCLTRAPAGPNQRV